MFMQRATEVKCHLCPKVFGSRNGRYYHLRNFHKVFGQEHVSEVQFLAYRGEVREQQRRRYHERRDEHAASTANPVSRSRPPVRSTCDVRASVAVRRVDVGLGNPGSPASRQPPRKQARRSPERSVRDRPPSGTGETRYDRDAGRRGGSSGRQRCPERTDKECRRDASPKSSTASSTSGVSIDEIHRSLQERGITMAARKEPSSRTMTLADLGESRDARVRSPLVNTQPILATIQPLVELGGDILSSTEDPVIQQPTESPKLSVCSTVTNVSQLMSPGTAAQVEELLLESGTTEFVAAPPLVSMTVESKPISRQQADSSCQVSSDDSDEDKTEEKMAAKRLFMNSVPADSRWSEKQLWTEAVKQPTLDPHELWRKVMGDDLPSPEEAKDFQLEINAIIIAVWRDVTAVTHRRSKARAASPR